MTCRVVSDHRTGRPAIGRRATLLGIALVSYPMTSWADEPANYPTRTVSITLPFAPGSASDSMARFCSQMLTRRLGQSFIVDNVTGASGIIGTARVARAAPDGYSLVIGSAVTVTLAPFLFKDLPYDPVKDLTPIATLGDSPIVVAVPATSSIHSLNELVAAAKAKPGGLSFGSGGTGSAAHVAAEVFKRKTGTDLAHIPYRGVAASVPDLVGGRLDVLFVSYPAVEPMARSGAVRILAVATATRSPLVPNAPTAAEAGVPGYVLSTWSGLMGPAGMAPQLVAKLNSNVNAVLTDPDVVKRLALAGMTPIPGTPEQFASRVKDEMAEMEQLAKSAHISAQ